MSKKSALAIAREGKVGKISIVGDIGWDWFGMSYRGFKQELKALGKVDMIELEINSPGGIVTDGTAIMNALSEHGAVIHTYINGQAASIASVIAMAGDKIFMPDNALMFVHKPLNLMIGNAEDMRKMADDLDKFETAIVNSYRRHFKGTDEEIKALMAAETWMTADEVDEKFSNVVVVRTKEQKAAAHSDPLEILGDVGMPSETILDRAVNAVRNRVTNNKEEDMPMTPEEKTELVTETTASVVAALKEAGVIKDEQEAPAPSNKVEVAFEGDMDNPEHVTAHIAKVEAAQMKASVDWNDPASVRKYQAFLAQKEPAAPATNSVVKPGKADASEEKFTSEAKEAAVERMVKNIK
jgi:ATP-dependent Clp protease protease subunit